METKDLKFQAFDKKLQKKLTSSSLTINLDFSIKKQRSGKLTTPENDLL